MHRLSLTLRALLLVPVLAVGVDLARATLACGPRAESCLEAAGRGWLGPAGIALVVLYSLALAVGAARLARGGQASPVPSPARSWLVGSAAVGAACAGQALLAGAMSEPAALGGGWAVVVPLCVLAGGVLAAALRVGPAVAAGLRDFRPAAPRPLAAGRRVSLAIAFAARRAHLPFAPAPPGRAPPATAV